MLKTRRGDTMIEVMFGVAIFGLIAISTISLMNNGLASSEANLETTMARNEMNAQAEALRFIHSSYATSGSVYKDIWDRITDNPLDSPPSSMSSLECEYYYNNEVRGSSFVFNTNSELALSENIGETLIRGNISDSLQPAPTFPIIENGRAYGIWINTVAGKINDSSVITYYDFYIRSCWYNIGSDTATTLDTIVRLYNPRSN